MLLDYLQVSFTDIGLCHRFTRFAVSQKNLSKVKPKIEEFVNELKSKETGILYHRLQEDEDLPEEVKKVSESPEKPKTGDYFTLCVVADPKKNTPPIDAIQEKDKASEEASKEGLLGIITNIREEIIKNEEGMDGKLSYWVKDFHKIVGSLCAEPPIYFELRPLIYKEN